MRAEKGNRIHLNQGFSYEGRASLKEALQKTGRTFWVVMIKRSRKESLVHIGAKAEMLDVWQTWKNIT